MQEEHRSMMRLWGWHAHHIGLPAHAPARRHELKRMLAHTCELAYERPYARITWHRMRVGRKQTLRHRPRVRKERSTCNLSASMGIRHPASMRMWDGWRKPSPASAPRQFPAASRRPAAPLRRWSDERRAGPWGLSGYGPWFATACGSHPRRSERHEPCKRTVHAVRCGACDMRRAAVRHHAQAPTRLAPHGLFLASGPEGQCRRHQTKNVARTMQRATFDMTRVAPARAPVRRPYALCWPHTCHATQGRANRLGWLRIAERVHERV